jgi:hypothetical protein
MFSVRGISSRFKIALDVFFVGEYFRAATRTNHGEDVQRLSKVLL